MKRSVVMVALVTSTASAAVSCTVHEAPPPTTASGTPGTAAPTVTPTATTGPTSTTPPTTSPTTSPTTAPTTASTVAPPTMPTVPSGGLPTFPGVCIPIGSWAKKFDSGIPASGTVDIGPPVLFNQFPVTDGVVIATAPVGTLKGVGAMTSTNDLSVDVSNGAFVVSYTCKFTGTSCNQGTCTTTKGGIGGFRLVKQ